MEIRRFANRTSLLLVVTVLLAMAVAGAVLAAEPAAEGVAAPGAPVTALAQPAAPPDGAPASIPLQDAAPAATDTGILPAAPDESPVLAAGNAPDDNPPSASVSSPGLRLTFSYYMASGATLRGRSSSTEYVYDGSGCVHVSVGSGTGRILNTELHIPDNSIIKYLRVYYRDTSATEDVSGYITRYQPGVGSLDLVHAASTPAFVGGYGSTVSSEITETVNNTSYAYTLIGWPGDTTSALQVCGLRVAYYAPSAGAASFLPVINKDVAP